MSIQVGEVIAVNGTKITLKIDDESSKETLFYAGQKYKGVSIREYISIQRGFRDIICIVEGEYLDESRVESDGRKVGYIRKVDARPIGYFHRKEFKQGIKYMPMIRDPAFLLQEEKIAEIFGGYATDAFTVGRMLKEDIPIGLPWQRLFNSHIGIFGNTGSGKSNTLTKLFTVLFEQKAAAIGDKSKFVILDFNGEYTSGQIAPAASKIVYHLSTQGGNQAGDAPAAQFTRFPLHESEFWSAETLSLLFQATQNTQKPFLSRLIEGRRKYESNPHSLTAYTKLKFKDAFCAGECKAATLDLMRSIARLIQHQGLIDALKEITWHSGQSRFTRSGSVYFDSNGQAYDAHLAPIVNSIDASTLDPFKQLILRANLQLISDLISGYVQFEHIQPLLKRIDASLNSLQKVLTIGQAQPDSKLLTVISLRRCNSGGCQGSCRLK